MVIQKVLTDNGRQFTDRFTSTGEKAPGTHSFDLACTDPGIEQGFASPRRPQTNGMVERFNGRISGLVDETNFAFAAELESTLESYLSTYKPSFSNAPQSNRHPFKRSRDGKRRSPIYS